MFTIREHSTIHEREEGDDMAVWLPTESEILDLALKKIKEDAILPNAHIEPVDERIGIVADAKLVFEEIFEERWIAVRSRLTMENIGAAAVCIRRMPKPGMLAIPYANRQIALELKKMDVQFLDCAGNMYLHQKRPIAFVWITGKEPVHLPAGRQIHRLFRAAGLRLVFLILCDPEAVGLPFRTLAGMAGVSLGTVANVFTDLDLLGYLRKTRKGIRRLENRNKLLDAWADAYPRVLKPTLQIAKYRTDAGEWWKTKDLGALMAYLGGEPAAALLTGFLRPEIATVYMDGPINTIAEKLRLVQDANGNVELFRKFWVDLPVCNGLDRLVPPRASARWNNAGDRVSCRK